MFDDNIKIHFAGNEDLRFHAALKAANVNYSLYSCYKSIVGKKPDSDFRLPLPNVFTQQIQDNRQVIQDSGLFTLMFGAGKGQKQTRETLTAWQDCTIEFIRQNNLHCVFVEVDCQKVLGIEEAWYFRERFRRIMPKERALNVFHFEDGRKGLDRMIEFSDYIAISVPELRIIKPKTFREDTHKLASYIKNKKPEIDIHLLGCTDFRIIAENKFCTSADSTSWLQGNKFGYISDGIEKKHIKNFKQEIFESQKKEVQKQYDRIGIHAAKPTSIKTYTNASICAMIHRQRYEKQCGSQK